MKLSAQIKLLPTAAQYQALLETLERANQACNAISQCAWENQTFGRVPLHKRVYYAIRERFGLSAQVTVGCISKVVEAYKVDRHRRRAFRAHGASAYDARILSGSLTSQSVSLWTLAGRERIGSAGGARQMELLSSQQGESDLCLVDGVFYLQATCEVAEPEAEAVAEYLGVDLGLENLAVDSQGQTFSGAAVKRVRSRNRRLRAKLQSKGTRGARRRLKQRRRKESRFVKHSNHCISKQLVEKAQRTRQGIALEELSGIRGRVRAGGRQRSRLHSWAFAQLRQFIEYKARQAGVRVEGVDPRHTSQRCFECGHVAKANRKSRNDFRCEVCGYAAAADFNAACNIASRAAVNQPDYARPGSAPS